MTLTTGLLAAYAGLSLLYWLRTLYGVLRTRRCVPVLATLNPPEPDRWPRLSVIVPACNEADKIASAARSLLDEDYPDVLSGETVIWSYATTGAAAVGWNKQIIVVGFPLESLADTDRVSAIQELVAWLD